MIVRDTNPIGGAPCWRYEVTYVTRNGTRVTARGWYDGTHAQAVAAANRAHAALRRMHGSRIKWKGNVGHWESFRIKAA